MKKRMTRLTARQILGHHICREMDNYYQGADEIKNMGNKSEYLSEYAVDLIETDEQEKARQWLQNYYYQTFLMMVEMAKKTEGVKQ
jgi:hypothetical protein